MPIMPIAENEVMSLSKQIEAVSEIVEQFEYNLKAAKNPAKKKHHKRALVFWASFLGSLKELEALKK